MLLPAFILAEATLSYVGLGFPEHLPTWGTMLIEAANLIGEFDEGFSNRQTWHNAALLAIAVWFEAVRRTPDAKRRKRLRRQARTRVR